MGPHARPLTFYVRPSGTGPARCACTVLMPAVPVAVRRLPRGHVPAITWYVYPRAEAGAPRGSTGGGRRAQP
jgi:hypothetical protein